MKFPSGSAYGMMDGSMSNARRSGKRRERKSFWTTVPGILSGVAGLLGAAAALLGIFASVGWLGTSEPERSPQAPPLDKVRLLFAYDPYDGGTTFGRLDVRFLPSGTRIIARCEGRGCFKGERIRDVREAAPVVSLLGEPMRLRRLHLRNGAKLEIRYVHPRAGSKIWTITAVRSREVVRFDIACAPPGEVAGPC